MDLRLVYITAKDESQACDIGKAMVEEKLAACANVFPKMTSIYAWEGKMTEEQEAVLILKTTKKNIDTLTQRVRELHTYECPCILIIAPEACNKEYAKWVEGAVGES